VKKEISSLKEEGEMSIEDLKKLYSMDTLGPGPNGGEEGGTSDSEDDNDFEASGDEVDDETTLAREEERQKRAGVCVDVEISNLEKEGKMPIEELRKLYQMDGMADFEHGKGIEDWHPTSDEENSHDSGDNDDESFNGDGSEEDDESTLAHEEERQKKNWVERGS